jgi:hypothetical protein
LIGLTRRLLRFTPAYRLKTGVFEASAEMVRKDLRDGA